MNDSYRIVILEEENARLLEKVEGLEQELEKTTLERGIAEDNAFKLQHRLEQAEVKNAELREVLKRIRQDFITRGDSIGNYSDGEYTQDYTTRLELVTKALSSTPEPQKDHRE